MDKLSEVINPENIDVPGLVQVLKGMEERISNIEDVLEMDDLGYRMNNEEQV
jgi:hypothetical protein